MLLASRLEVLKQGVELQRFELVERDVLTNDPVVKECLKVGLVEFNR